MRVLITPTETAGQAQALAEGLKYNDINAELVTVSPHRFDYEVDVCLDLSVNNRLDVYKNSTKLLWEFLKRIHYDFFVFWLGNSLVPKRIDMRILNLINKPAIAVFQGTAVRLESIASENNPYYPNETHTISDQEKIKRMKNISELVDAAVVGNYELLPYVEPYFESVNCIQSGVDTKTISPSYPDLETTPKVVHAPSDRNKKGTETILNAVSELRSEHEINFKLLENLDNTDVLEQFKSADIVIDQLRLGSFGMVSLEAMACGTASMAYIRDDLLNKRLDDFPLITTSPDTFQSDLKQLLNNPEEINHIGKQSRRYIENYHDQRLIAEEWIELFGSV